MSSRKTRVSAHENRCLPIVLVKLFDESLVAEVLQVTAHRLSVEEISSFHPWFVIAEGPTFGICNTPLGDLLNTA